MKKELVKTLTDTFQDHSNTTDNGIEFWFARDIQHLMGYAEWRNFINVITKAKTSCEVSGNNISDHFVDINKMVNIGSGAQKPVDDIMLTRYACYLIAQNGDSKDPIAFAQNYFAVQTRKYEIIEQRINDWERLQARGKLSLSEKELSSIIYEQTGSDKNFGIIRSKGDAALFGGKTTQQMKNRLGVPKDRALADFLPTITIKAKDFATEITIFNAKEKFLKTESDISSEHIKNNKGVRKLLLDRGIKPEELPAEEDIKKLERRVKSEGKQIGRKPDKLTD